jgi:hypothetical protein
MVGALVSLLARAVEAHQNPRFADASTLTGRAFADSSCHVPKGQLCLSRGVEAHADVSPVPNVPHGIEELRLPILIAIAFAGITVGPLAGLAIALVGRLRRGSIAPQRRLIEHLP